MVEAGRYIENELTVPAFVYIYGHIMTSVVVEPAGNHNVFNLLNNSGLVQLTIQNCPQKAINIIDCGFYTFVHTIACIDIFSQ